MKIMMWSTHVVAVIILIVGVLRMVFGDSGGRFDETTLLYLFGSAAVFLLTRTKSFQFGDLKFELQQMKDEIKEATLVANIAQDAIAMESSGRDASVRSSESAEEIVPGDIHDDPWKGVFGGSPIDPGMGRMLTAEVEKLASLKGWYSVTLTVTGLPNAQALNGPIRFFLHDSFVNDRPVVQAIDNRAVLHLKAWGAFTVGVLADDGRCKLELDLAGIESAPWEFRSR